MPVLPASAASISTGSAVIKSYSSGESTVSAPPQPPNNTLRAEREHGVIACQIAANQSAAPPHSQPAPPKPAGPKKKLKKVSTK